MRHSDVDEKTIRNDSEKSEARIGQLLGEAKPGPKQSSVVTEVSDKDDRADFRMLARALNEGSVR